MAALTGSDWPGVVLTCKVGAAVLDLTGFTLLLQFRARRGAETVLLQLGSGSGLTIDPTAGRVTFGLTAAQTSALGAGDRYWALVRTDGGRHLALGTGRLSVREGI